MTDLTQHRDPAVAAMYRRLQGRTPIAPRPPAAQTISAPAKFAGRSRLEIVAAAAANFGRLPWSFPAEDAQVERAPAAATAKAVLAAATKVRMPADAPALPAEPVARAVVLAARKALGGA